MHAPVSGATDGLVTTGGGWLRRPKTGISSITALVIVPARTGLWTKSQTDGGARSELARVRARPAESRWLLS
jgi:hypothetical protein